MLAQRDQHPILEYAGLVEAGEFEFQLAVTLREPVQLGRLAR
jgi:hypothetical protein